MANGTSAKGLDLSGFYSQRFQHIGLTVFGSRNTGSAYDPAGIGLTAIPKFERYTINPACLFMVVRQMQILDLAISQKKE
jgi:iron complex outermembrane receptor protein